MRQIYNVGIYFFSFIIKVHSIFSSKSKKLIKGHREAIYQLTNDSQEEYVWVHAASLGEFEQGKSIIESICASYPEQKILLTFFSPSGFEIRKNYQFASKVIYLPFDTRANAKLFVRHLKIKLAVFIKYEFWFNYLEHLEKNQIPIFYISTSFRKNHFFFKSTWMMKIIKNVNHIFVQSEKSKEIGESNGLHNITVTGDTRLDTALRNAQENFHCDQIEKGLDGRKVIVLGSAWEGDYTLLANFIKKWSNKFQFIVAPHEVDSEQVNSFVTSLSISVSWLSRGEQLKDILIVDTIGSLKYLYRYADVVIIGGGYNHGIHNTLEPLVYGVPILFGPKNYDRFPEAVYIHNHKMGGVATEKEFSDLLEYFLNNEKTPIEVQLKAASYVKEHRGATEKIMSKLKIQLES
ncbi:MAG: 3-deoxy-D-manno-octulosonic acid transferase [Flavobacteriales bacterium]|nr:3-deoxy-D-manno-octulosonic acid transferase [Flavobacteriales bacterium]|tara:strand:- start:5329 stop:6546 length:1218 start_codon:yes stop_codon:yes gene_type:complete